MRHTLIAAASVLMLTSSPAFSQAASTTEDAKPQPPASSRAPAAATGSTSAPAAPAGGATGAEAEAPTIARASRLMGRNIENTNGDDIGEIKDMVIDPKTGQVQQVVVGVGGFLGIGEKNVALQWKQLQIQQEVRRAATAPAPGTPGPATTPGTPATTPVPGTPASRADGKPAAGDGTAPASRGLVTAGGPRIVVHMTKEQLKAAPEFRFEEERAPTGSMAPGRTAPAGNTTR